MGSDITAVARASGQFSTLLSAAEAAGLTPTLMSGGPFTVFAPTDAAFARLPGGTLERPLMPANRDALRQVVSYHVVSGRVSSAALSGRSMESASLEGAALRINGRNGVMVNSARVTQPDIQPSNGVIHVIDAVLPPPDMAALR